MAQELYQALVHAFDPKLRKYTNLSHSEFNTKQTSTLATLKRNLAIDSLNVIAKANCLKLAHTIICVHKFGIAAELQANYEKLGQKGANKAARCAELTCSGRYAAVLQALKDNKRLALDVSDGHLIDRLARDPAYELGRKWAWMDSNKNRDKQIKDARNILQANTNPMASAIVPASQTNKKRGRGRHTTLALQAPPAIAEPIQPVEMGNLYPMAPPSTLPYLGMPGQAQLPQTYGDLDMQPGAAPQYPQAPHTSHFPGYPNPYANLNAINGYTFGAGHNQQHMDGSDEHFVDVNSVERVKYDNQSSFGTNGGYGF